MKRIFLILLACLMLTGCGGNSSQPTEPRQDTAAQIPTEPAGSYLPNSELESATAGALRVYAPDLGNIRDIQAMDDDLLVISDRDATVITRLTGENLFRVAQIQLERHVSCLFTGENQIIYFDSETGELVYLNQDLREIRRVPMPEDLMGEPMLTADRTRMYYCTAAGVRCQDMQTGISRLVKEMSFALQSVVDIHMGDTVLQVEVMDENGNRETLFLDAQTGSLMGGLPEGITLTTSKEYYYAIDPEGEINQMIFGRAGEEATQLHPRNYLDSGIFLEEVHAAVVFHKNGMDYYDLATGNRTATLAMTGSQVEDLTSSGNGYVYFCTANTIYRWNLAATPTADEAVYTGTWYNRMNPNVEGLEICDAYAAQLSQRHGLEIVVGDIAALYTNKAYSPVSEYQTAVIMDALMQLEELLQAFPQGFFETAVEGFENGAITICLVRDLPGSYASGTRESVDAIQFWDGDHAYISLAMGENMEENFYHNLFHVLEARVLSDTIAYYRWDELNPRGFQYDNDYIVNESRDGSAYLEEKSRAFIDTFSMSFETEDRATIMAYACMEGQENYFISYTMQKKLRTLCQGIREAYGLEDSTQVFLWEQYLEGKLAPEV